MSGKRAYLIGGALSVLAGLGVPASASAQASADSTAPEIEQIIVTARKRAENLQDVPGAIVATQEEAIRALRITDVQTLSQYVPSFTHSIAGPNARYYLRGVGSGSNASFEQAVSTFVDNIYAGRGQEGRRPYFDLESIDVQLGPQVVLYGNSSTGGAISVVTRRPTSEFTVDLDAAYEFQHNQTTLQGAVNLPVSDQVRVRVAAYADDLNRGWIRTSRPAINPPNLTYDPRVHDRAARLSVQLLPTEDLDILLKYEVTDAKQLGGTLQVVSNPLGYPFLEGDFDLSRQIGNPAPYAYSAENLVTLNSQTLLAAVNYKVGGGDLTSTTGYSWYDYDSDQEADMSRLGVFGLGQFENYKQFSQELRFSSGVGEKLEYIVGAYYQRSTLDLLSNTDVNPAALAPFAAFNPAFAGFGPVPPFSRTAYLDQKQTDVSVFADVTYHVTDRLEIELGARYAWTRKTGDQGARASNLGTTILNPTFEAPLPFLPPVGNPPIPAIRNSFYSLVFSVPHDLQDLRLTEEHFMPEAIVKYDLGEGSMVYAKAVRGAKAGGFDWLYGGDANTFTARASGPASATFRPETATSYEIGLRGQGLDRKLQYGVTIYQNEVDDLQVSVFNGGTNFVVGNASTRSRGIEGNFTYRPWAALTLTGVGSYIDSKFTNFPGAACTYEQSLVFVRTPTQATCVQDLTGVRLPQPKVMYNLSATYVAAIGGDYTLTSRLQWNYRGPYNFSDTNDPLLRRKSVGLLDARVALAPVDGDWEASVFAKNITDELWSDFGASLPLISGAVLADTQRPFQIGVQFRVSFGR